MVVRITSASHRGPVRTSWNVVIRLAPRSNRTRRGTMLSVRTAGLMPRVTTCRRSAPGAVADRRAPEEADRLGRSAVTRANSAVTRRNSAVTRGNSAVARGSSPVTRGNSALDTAGEAPSGEAKYAASLLIVGWSYRSVGGSSTENRSSSSTINSMAPRESRPTSNSGRSWSIRSLVSAAMYVVTISATACAIAGDADGGTTVVGSASAGAWRVPIRSAMRCFCTLPLCVRGSSSRKCTRYGTLKFASSFRHCSFTRSAVGSAPVRTMATSTTSPST